MKKSLKDLIIYALFMYAFAASISITLAEIFFVIAIIL